MLTLLRTERRENPCLIDGRPTKILVLDDERAIREFCKVILDPLDVEVMDCSLAEEAEELLQQESFDIVLADLQLPGVSGLDLLRRSQDIDATVVVIIITGHGTVDNAVEAMKEGAFDYLQKPLSPEAVRAAVRKAAAQRELALENVRLRRLLQEKYGFGNIIGRSAIMEKVFSLVRKAASSDSPVLINGEPGSGKDLIARAVHVHSSRERYPFIRLDCAGINPTRFEEELFGPRSDASPRRAAKSGSISQAHRGTLVLVSPEVMPRSCQAKLAPFLLQEQAWVSYGEEPGEIDVRLILTTNSDLEQEVREGRFREDLYLRAGSIQITVPPLRSRTEDIPLLAQHFLGKNGKEAPRPTPEVRSILMNYSWPGNVRELESVIQQAAFLSTGKEIHVQDLPPNLWKKDTDQAALPGFDRSHLLSLEDGEKLQVEYVFTALRGHRGKTASVLQISRRSLYDKLKRYGITK